MKKRRYVRENLNDCSFRIPETEWHKTALKIIAGRRVSISKNKLYKAHNLQQK